jgi:hypothetical protein
LNGIAGLAGIVDVGFHFNLGEKAHNSGIFAAEISHGEISVLFDKIYRYRNPLAAAAAAAPPSITDYFKFILLTSQKYLCDYDQFLFMYSIKPTDVFGLAPLNSDNEHVNIPDPAAAGAAGAGAAAAENIVTQQRMDPVMTCTYYANDHVSVSMFNLYLYMFDTPFFSRVYSCFSSGAGGYAFCADKNNTRHTNVMFQKTDIITKLAKHYARIDKFLDIRAAGAEAEAVIGGSSEHRIQRGGYKIENNNYNIDDDDNENISYFVACMLYILIHGSLIQTLGFPGADHAFISYLHTKLNSLKQIYHINESIIFDVYSDSNKYRTLITLYITHASKNIIFHDESGCDFEPKTYLVEYNLLLLLFQAKFNAFLSINEGPPVYLCIDLFIILNEIINMYNIFIMRRILDENIPKLTGVNREHVDYIFDLISTSRNIPLQDFFIFLTPELSGDRVRLYQILMPPV